MKAKKGIVFAGMGFELAGLIVGGLFLGKHLDETYDLGGLATGGLAFAVLAGWLIHLVALIKKFQAEDDVETEGKTTQK